MQQFIPDETIISGNTNMPDDTIISDDTIKSDEKIVNMLCEYINNPLGIDDLEPLLSWQIASNERGIMQSFYRIQVASSKEKLGQGDYDLWDSGKISSHDSANVKYNGRKLKSAMRCYWKVQVWDGENRIYEPTETAWWEMGLLEPSDWKGKWIEAGKNYIPGWSPLFRKEFSVEKKIKRARAYICAPGYYELYINGSKIGDHILDPAQTDYEMRNMYVVYDITQNLSEGINAAGVMLGDGWYHQNCVWGGKMAYGQPCIILQISIEHTDGTIINIVTDDKWKMRYGPITLNNIYAGETYDARLETPGWCEAPFDDSNWCQVQNSCGPRGRLVAQIIPPIKKMEKIKPVKITEPQEHVYIFDMGRNFAGWVKLKVSGAAGGEVTLRYAEILDDSGNLSFDSGGTKHTRVIQTDRYILKGNGMEVWEPRFTYHGFRFVEVTGFTGEISLDSIEGIAVYTSLEASGNFECSDAMINKIHKVVINTITSNIHSVPTDCPVRERCGWLGDALIIADTVMYNWNSVNFWRKYVGDIESTRHSNGNWFMVAPGKRRCGEAAPAWGTAQVIIPWLIYNFYGDKQILEKYYDDIKAWTYKLLSRSEDYIVSYGIDDWWPPGNRQNKDLPAPLISTAFFYISANLTGVIADILSNKEDAEKFTALSKDIRTAFIKKYFDCVNNTYGTQTANCFALHLGLVPEGKSNLVVRSIVNDLEKHNYHLTTGHIGVKYIFDVLTEYGYGDIAYKILVQSSYPSFGHQMEMGATTLWETWEGTKNLNGTSKMGSLNHPFKGGFDTWFYSHILGVKLMDIAFKKFSVKPHIVGNIESANGFYDSLYGRIEIEWKASNGCFTLSVTVPANTTAKIHLPYDEGDKIFEGKLPISEAFGVEYLNDIPGYKVFDVASGRYCFRCAT